MIGRRAPDKIALERHKGFVLDLRDADLRGADLRDGDFAQARFWRSNFQFAVLTRTNLKGAQLNGATLSYARLVKTRFDANTDLENTTFDKAFVFNTDFSKTGVTQEQLSQMFARWRHPRAARPDPPDPLAGPDIAPWRILERIRGMAGRSAPHTAAGYA